MSDSGKEVPSGDFKSPEVPATVEKQQEQLLKKKYGNLPMKSGSRLLQNRLNQRGGAKYFDSGDYNMAKAKAGAGDQKPPEMRGEVTGSHMPTPEEIPRMRKSSQSNLVIPKSQS